MPNLLFVLFVSNQEILFVFSIELFIVITSWKPFGDDNKSMIHWNTSRGHVNCVF